MRIDIGRRKQEDVPVCVCDIGDRPWEEEDRCEVIVEDSDRARDEHT